MRAKRIECPSCGQCWDPATARFCGACGDRLLVTWPGSRPGEKTIRGRGAWIAAAVLGPAVILVAAVGLTVEADLRTSLSSDAPAMEVDLPARPSPSEAGTGPAAADPDTAVLAATDPGPLRCEPTGCARWRHTLPAAPDVVTGGHGLVVARAGDRLHALEASTGGSRWTSSLRGPTADGTYSVAFDPPSALAVGEDLVVASGGPGWVQARSSEDGSLRWSVRLDHRVARVLISGDGAVLAVGPGSVEDGPARVTGLDARDGGTLSEDELPEPLADDHRSDQRSVADRRFDLVSRVELVSDGYGGLRIQAQDGTAWLSGWVSGSATLVHEQPLVFEDAGELLGVRLVRRDGG